MIISTAIEKMIEFYTKRHEHLMTKNKMHFQSANLLITTYVTRILFTEKHS